MNIGKLIEGIREELEIEPEKWESRCSRVYLEDTVAGFNPFTSFELNGEIKEVTNLESIIPINKRVFLTSKEYPLVANVNEGFNIFVANVSFWIESILDGIVTLVIQRNRFGDSMKKLLVDVN